MRIINVILTYTISISETAELEQRKKSFCNLFVHLFDDIPLKIHFSYGSFPFWIWNSFIISIQVEGIVDNSSWTTTIMDADIYIGVVRMLYLLQKKAWATSLTNVRNMITSDDLHANMENCHLDIYQNIAK
ncbi:hypothetical protein POM88_044229 [Heracleum sosnowskyi]|uniref:Uncharacterized protein n=1 Tax=Heracleum sosnowskyi TaxID=360622 RepID=A0AAD8H508_9APIA|nr:hypothetical protein POM88_044229 [Heracleum sosnowskyi]